MRPSGGGGGGCSICHCEFCTCGPDCQCTEDLCKCSASKLLDSLGCTKRQLPLSSNGDTKTNRTDEADHLLVSSAYDEEQAGLVVVASESTSRTLNHTITVELAVDGMTCTNCASAVQRALQQVSGVRQAQVEVATDTATVTYDSDNNAASTDMVPSLINAIEAVGYHATVLKGNVANEATGANTATTVHVAIGGMTCSMCSQAIERALTPQRGILDVTVSLTAETATVTFDRNILSLDDIRNLIENVGYQVDHIDATSASPVAGNDHHGDNSNDPQTRWEQLTARQRRKVRDKKQAFLWSLLGTIPILYVTMVVPYLAPWSSHAAWLQQHIHWAHHQLQIEALLLWALATPIQFVAGRSFYVRTYYAVRHRTAGMDVLVAMGTTASYCYALWGMWSDDDHAAHFFETSSVLICFVLLGKWMQALAVRQTSQALSQLWSLQSTSAILVTPHDDLLSPQQFDPLRHGYTEASVPIAQVHPGALVKVIRGAAVPADGRVVYGELSVDESMVTGESVPVLKTVNSIVLGGTICVEGSSMESTDRAKHAKVDNVEPTDSASIGAAFIEVTGVGSATALSQIVQLVQQAQQRAVPIQSFTDQISSVFVPAVGIIALMTGICWFLMCEFDAVPASWYEELGESRATFALKFAIACLVISCPCALGLATPTAVMTGSGVGAKLGVLIKGGEAMEIASKVDAVVFDKTGTLTRGTPEITDFALLKYDMDLDTDGATMDTYILWLLGSLERTSEHPLAKAVVQHAEQELGEEYLFTKPFGQARHFRAVTGRGASGTLPGNIQVAVGNRAYMHSMDVEVTAQSESQMRHLEEAGKTAILAAIQGQACVVMGVADQLKEDAVDSVAFLRNKLHMDVWMVTGDNARTAAAISRKLGLPKERVISEALPAAKVEHVRKLQSDGFTVAMVGDGVNDSPALAQADVGLALGSGAEIAAEAADIVLVKSHVADVCTAFDLSRVIFRRIQWNLMFSLLYNCLGIPVAAGVFYPVVRMRLPPTLAALAMALSSVSVVLSSLALRLYEKPRVARLRQRALLTTDDEIPSQEHPRRAPSRRRPDESSQMTANLLAHDHLAASEMTDATAIIDNRSVHFNE